MIFYVKNHVLSCFYNKLSQVSIYSNPRVDFSFSCPSLRSNPNSTQGYFKKAEFLWNTFPSHKTKGCSTPRTVLPYGERRKQSFLCSGLKVLTNPYFCLFLLKRGLAPLPPQRGKKSYTFFRGGIAPSSCTVKSGRVRGGTGWGEPLTSTPLTLTKITSPLTKIKRLRRGEGNQLNFVLFTQSISTQPLSAFVFPYYIKGSVLCASSYSSPICGGGGAAPFFNSNISGQLFPPKEYFGLSLSLRFPYGSAVREQLTSVKSFDRGRDSMTPKEFRNPFGPFSFSSFGSFGGLSRGFASRGKSKGRGGYYLPKGKERATTEEAKKERNKYYTSYSKLSEVKLLTIGIASPLRILQWAEKTLPNGKIYGEVLNANTLHHKTFKPQKGGLFCERIFGPLKDFECACGKIDKSSKQSQTLFPARGGVEGSLNNPLSGTEPFIKERQQTNVNRKFCPDCDVEYTWSVIRRYQLGYIKLCSPVTHIWFLKGTPSYLSLLLDMKKRYLQFITYCSEILTIEKSSLPIYSVGNVSAPRPVLRASAEGARSPALAAFCTEGQSPSDKKRPSFVSGGKAPCTKEAKEGPRAVKSNSQSLLTLPGRPFGMVTPLGPLGQAGRTSPLSFPPSFLGVEEKEQNWKKAKGKKEKGPELLKRVPIPKKGWYLNKLQSNEGRSGGKNSALVFSLWQTNEVPKGFLVGAKAKTKEANPYGTTRGKSYGDISALLYSSLRRSSCFRRSSSPLRTATPTETATLRILRSPSEIATSSATYSATQSSKVGPPPAISFFPGKQAHLLCVAEGGLFFEGRPLNPCKEPRRRELLLSVGQRESVPTLLSRSTMISILSLSVFCKNFSPGLLRGNLPVNFDKFDKEAKIFAPKDPLEKRSEGGRCKLPNFKNLSKKMPIDLYILCLLEQMLHKSSLTLSIQNTWEYLYKQAFIKAINKAKIICASAKEEPVHKNARSSRNATPSDTLWGSFIKTAPSFIKAEGGHLAPSPYTRGGGGVRKISPLQPSHTKGSNKWASLATNTNQPPLNQGQGLFIKGLKGFPICRECFSALPVQERSTGGKVTHRIEKNNKETKTTDFVFPCVVPPATQDCALPPVLRSRTGSADKAQKNFIARGKNKYINHVLKLLENIRYPILSLNYTTKFFCASSALPVRERSTGGSAQYCAPVPYGREAQKKNRLNWVQGQPSQIEKLISSEIEYYLLKNTTYMHIFLTNFFLNSSILDLYLNLYIPAHSPLPLLRKGAVKGKNLLLLPPLSPSFLKNGGSMVNPGLYKRGGAHQVLCYPYRHLISQREKQWDRNKENVNSYGSYCSRTGAEHTPYKKGEKENEIFYKGKRDPKSLIKTTQSVLIEYQKFLKIKSAFSAQHPSAPVLRSRTGSAEQAFSIFSKPKDEKRVKREGYEVRPSFGSEKIENTFEKKPLYFKFLRRAGQSSIHQLHRAPSALPVRERSTGGRGSNKKNLYNNVYTLSHRERWDIEKDWQIFTLFTFGTTEYLDSPIYTYKNRLFSFINLEDYTGVGQSPSGTSGQVVGLRSRRTPFLKKGVLRRLGLANEAPAVKGLPKMFPSPFTPEGGERTLQAQFSVGFLQSKAQKGGELGVAKAARERASFSLSSSFYSGAGIVQQLLNEFDFYEIKKLDTQNRLILYQLNKYILKLKKQVQIFVYDKTAQIELKELCKKRDLLIRRTKLVRKLFRKNSNPASMILTLIPVLPPDLRPIVKMGSQIAASDLNRLYQRVIYRNDRLKKFLKDPATSQSYEMKYAQRLLQEAVDNLLQNGKSGPNSEKDARGRALKSLSDVLKGKQGRFRQFLLGKRVDYSGRSVIVVGPKLKLHECGLPLEMAKELYLPFLLKSILNKNYAKTVVGAKTLIKNNSSLAHELLREIMQVSPVLLNRAPTLHRLGIQAFVPKLIEGRAILLHPLVCSAFNADFDGDQMAVHIPITVEARAEAWKIMLSRNNILSTATGDPLAIPSQDMVLGCYYLTTFSNHGKNLRGSGMYFNSLYDVIKVYEQRLIDVHSLVWVKWTNNIENGTDQEDPLEIRLSSFGQWQEITSNYHRIFDSQNNLISQYICTTPGRILFNLIIQKTTIN